MHAPKADCQEGIPPRDGRWFWLHPPEGGYGIAWSAAAVIGVGEARAP